MDRYPVPCEVDGPELVAAVNVLEDTDPVVAEH